MSDDVYQGPQGGSWFTASNWSLGIVPAEGSSADVAGESEVVIDSGTVSDTSIYVTAAYRLEGAEYQPASYNLDVDQSGFIDDASTVIVDNPLVNTSDDDYFGSSVHLGAFAGRLVVSNGAYLFDFDPVVDDTISVSDGSILSLYSGNAGITSPNDQIAIDGMIVDDGSQIGIFSNSVTGSGTVALRNSASVVFAAPLGTANVAVDVQFDDGSNSQLGLDQDSLEFTGKIYGFGGQNTISVGSDGNSSPNSDTLSFYSNTLTIYNRASVVLRITFSGNYTAANFSISSQNVISFVPDVPCFAAGTLIETALGQNAIEDLRVGDLVRTVGRELRKIVWTGYRYVDLASHHDPALARPIVLRCGAFAPNVPARDLRLSPDHNVAIEGVLIPAKCLVNGLNVLVDFEATSVTYHHIELATHDLVLAEGLAAETYLDVGNRDALSSGADRPADFFSTVDLNWWRWEAMGCRRLVLAGPELDRARASLRQRALGRQDEVRGNLELHVDM